MKTVRIGNGAGFWGDNLDAPRLLAEGANLEYLTLEYLAELTLSILAHQKARDPEAGYVTDFPVVLESLLPSLRAQPHLKIVTNAGGLNPSACARRVSDVLRAAGLDAMTVGIVTGDDLLPNIDDHVAAGESFTHLDSGLLFAEIRGRLVSANVYLGAGGIAEALSQGAKIVITGRVADASLTVGPAMHEFGWSWNDWDRLAAATVAGHLIECGAQVTGGMYSEDCGPLAPRAESDSRSESPTLTIASRLANVGYPIAELSEDGSLVITKPDGTGGCVSIGTVSEQLVYEIGDPAHYLTPDMDADFSQIRLSQEGEHRVLVSGAHGNPAPERYKVSMAYHDGYTSTGTLVVAGPTAVQNARVCADVVMERLRRTGVELERTHVEYLGTGDSLPGLWPKCEPPEVVLRISVADPRRKAVERFCRELAPLVTSGPPGVTGYTGARPKPRPVLAYWPTTIARSRVQSTVTVRTAQEWLA